MQADREIVRYDAAGGVVIANERMLLLDRPSRGEVRLPKGHIDPGETVRTAALRETIEESGYADLEIIADLGSHVVEFDLDQGNSRQHYIRTEHYFLMNLLSPHQVARDAVDEQQFTVLWVPLSLAADRLTFDSEQAVAQKAIDTYQNLSQD